MDTNAISHLLHEKCVRVEGWGGLGGKKVKGLRKEKEKERKLIDTDNSVVNERGWGGRRG